VACTPRPPRPCPGRGLLRVRVDPGLGDAARQLAGRLGPGWRVDDLATTTARLANSITSVDLAGLVVIAILFVSLLVFGNGIFASGRVQRLPDGAVQHIYGYLPLLGTPISAESITFALTQFLRFMAMIAIGFPLAFAIDPAAFGVTFARLGVPYRFAYAIDLTWRFIPSFAADFRTTMDAQRVRGMDIGERVGGPLARLRRQVPILVPTIVNAIAGAEDTIDAMDLRAFGTGKRTWIRELRLDPTDRVVLIGFVALFVVATVAGFTTGSSFLWIPPFLIPS